MINVKWTGAAGLEFCYDGGTVLVDPYYSRISKFRMFFGKVAPDADLIKNVCLDTGKVNAVIVGHSHFDHVMDIPCFAEYLDCMLIGNDSLSALMERHGMSERVFVCKGRETVKIDDAVSVKMIPSEHGRVVLGRVPFSGEISRVGTLPMKASDYRHGTVFAPLLNIAGKTFLHLGSSGYIGHELEGCSCDVLFLCVPGWKKTKDYPERVLELTTPECVVLFHYDDFFKKYNGRTDKLKFLDMETMVSRIKEHSPGVDIITPDLFESLEF